LALLVSVLLHLLVLFFFPSFFLPYDSQAVGARGEPRALDEFGLVILPPPSMEAQVNVIGRPGAPAPGSASSPPVVTVDPVPSAGVSEALEVASPESESERPSVAERLRPQMVDPRLWAPVERLGIDLTDEERPL
jgi:hypothetical protein